METMQAYLTSMLQKGKADGCFPSAAAAVGIKDQVLAKAFAGEAPLPGDRQAATRVVRAVLF